MSSSLARLAAVAVAFTLAMAYIAPPAHAQQPPAAAAEAPIVFFDFEEVLLRGELRRPPGLLYTHRERARFERLVQLERPVLPRLKETAKDTALR